MNSNLKESVTHYTGKSSYEERVVGQNDFKNNKKKIKEESKEKQEIRKCSGCGATVNSNDGVCEFCGTKL